jgi:soluble lytic murein transglycosylase-like protein
MRRAVFFGVFVAAASGAAVAQVYVGQSAEGSIVLSSNVNEDAHTLLIEAEMVPLAVLSGEAVNAAFITTVPAGYWPFIQEASKAYQLPSELIHAVILVESNYNPRAISPKGAQGLMQLMPATAKRFGGANSWDPRQNILTGSRYLRWLLDYFGDDLELTIAAYNAGEGAVMQAGRKIPRFSETERYVPKVLSAYRKAKRQA